jgi:thioredoxin 1
MSSSDIIIEICSLNEWHQVLKLHKNVIILASAEWCAPCKKLYPHYTKLAESKSIGDDLLFAKFDVDQVEELFEELEVTGMPSLFFFQNEKQIDTQVGANLETLTKFVQKNYK